MAHEEIRLERKNKITLLTLNRPEIRNALTGELMIGEILKALNMVKHDDRTHVLIITGTGSAFSAGGNIKDMQNKKGMFKGTPEEIADKYRSGIQRIPRALYALDLPVIAAVNGPAIGAGCDLACMCDIRIASKKARFGETFASLALVPGDGGAFFLPRVVGFARAAELAYTCRIIDAEKALAIGLVNEVVDPEELMERAVTVAEEIAQQPKKTLAMTKQLFRIAEQKGLLDVLDASAAFQGHCHHLPEHGKAVARLLAKTQKH